MGFSHRSARKRLSCLTKCTTIRLNHRIHTLIIFHSEQPLSVPDSLSCHLTSCRPRHSMSHAVYDAKSGEGEAALQSQMQMTQRTWFVYQLPRCLTSWQHGRVIRLRSFAAVVDKFLPLPRMSGGLLGYFEYCQMF
jgi:hypothetical protein